MLTIAQVQGTVTVSASGGAPVGVSGSGVFQVSQASAWGSAVSGVVGVTQSGPFAVLVSGSSNVTQASAWGALVSGVVGVVQSGALAALVSGSASVSQGGPWGVQVSGVVTSTLTGTVGVTQASAWSGLVSGTVGVVQSGALAVLVSGSASVTQNSAWATLVSGSASVKQDSAWASLVSGVVGITQSGSLAAQVSGTVTATFTGNLPMPVVTVTSSLASPVWVTQSQPISASVSSSQMLALDPSVAEPALPVRVIFPIEHISAFGELMTTQKVCMLSLNFNYSINSYFAVTSSVSGGTVSQSQSMAVVRTNASASASAQLESKGAVRYLAGTGMNASFTALFTSGVADSRQEVGLGDTSDGLFWGYSGTQFGAFLRNSGSDTFVGTGSFSHDHLDGSGRSGYTLDPTKLELFKVEFGWHGSGPCKWYVMDVPSGRWILANVVGSPVTAPRFGNPTLPFHMRAVSLGSTTDLAIRTASAGIYRESTALQSDNPIDGALGATGSSLSIAATELPVISIRCTGTFQGQPNKVRVQLTNISLNDAGAAGTISQVRVRLNPTLTSASFVPFDSATSVVEVDTAATAVSGGREIFRTVVNGQFSTVEDLSAHGIFVNPGDVIAITGQHIAGGGSTMGVQVSFNERFSG